jgi:hypothetical protein
MVPFKTRPVMAWLVPNMIKVLLMMQRPGSFTEFVGSEVTITHSGLFCAAQHRQWSQCIWSIKKTILYSSAHSRIFGPAQSGSGHRPAMGCGSWPRISVFLRESRFTSHERSETVPLRHGKDSEQVPFFKVAPDSNLFNRNYPPYIFLCKPELFFKRPLYNFFFRFP